MNQVRELAVEDVSPNPRNPRKHFAESKLEELAESIDNQGLLQPVLARPQNGTYELVHGERRLRAVKRLEKDTIRAEVRELSDREALEISVTENLQREDVSPLSEAEAYQLLIEEFDLTQEEAAERVGKSQSHIANQLRLLKLPDRLQESILHKIISPWQARELAKVWGEYWLWDLTVDHELSVSELRQVISQLNEGKKFVSITREWPIESLEKHADEEFGVDFDTDDKYAVHEASQARMWANENIQGFDHRLDQDSKFEVQPLVYSWVSNNLVLGGQRIRLALDYGYEGDLAIEINFPRELFSWDLRCARNKEEAPA